MKNYTNIYDIDGDIIRAAGDNKEMTIEEAQKRIAKYKEKIEKCEENDPKIATYNNYISNLTSLIAMRMNQNYKFIQPTNTPLNEQIENAMNELKEQVENEETQSKETIMDEYVDFEEVK